MANVVKKQNMTIAIREYIDNQGQTKKVWKTIGELVTWDDGKQSFEVWGPTGSTRGSIFDQDNNQAPQQRTQAQQRPQQGFTGQPQQRPQQPQQGGQWDDFDVPM